MAVFEVIDVFAFVSEPSCLFEPNFFDSLYFKVCAPLAVMCFLAVATNVVTDPKTKAKFFDLFVVISFSVYPGLCNSLFVYFDCRTYEDHEEYLVTDPTIKCTDEKTNNSFVLPLALTVPIAIPAYYFYSLVKSKQFLVPPLAFPDDLDASFERLKNQVLIDYDVIQTTASRKRVFELIAFKSAKGFSVQKEETNSSTKDKEEILRIVAEAEQDMEVLRTKKFGFGDVQVSQKEIEEYPHNAIYWT
eukprot:g498.t1